MMETKEVISIKKLVKDVKEKGKAYKEIEAKVWKVYWDAQYPSMKALQEAQELLAYAKATVKVD